MIEAYTSKLMDFSSYFWKFGAGLLFVTSVAVGLLYYHQDSLLYFPTVGGQVPRRTRSNPRKYRSPGEHSIPFEEHFISCSDGVAIHTWILYSKQSTEDQRSSRPTVLFFHGNAGNIGLRLPIGVHMVEYLQVNVMMVEYRGYGDSHDVPKLNEEGLKLDAEAALEFARNHSLLRTTPLFVYGQSLVRPCNYPRTKRLSLFLMRPRCSLIASPLSLSLSLSRLLDLSFLSRVALLHSTWLIMHNNGTPLLQDF
jgi:pimeloyl-ACP methyl ester carboxylesterase